MDFTCSIPTSARSPSTAKVTDHVWEISETSMKTIARTFIFESDSDPDRTYQTLQYTDGTTSCDCKGWTRRNPPGGRTCKHVRYVLAGLGNRHAISVVEQSTVTGGATPQRAMPEPTFDRSRRKFQLEEKE